MGQIVTFTYECEHCDGVARSSIEYLGRGPEDSIEVEIDDLSQIVLTCDECVRSYYTGDIEVLTEEDL